MNQRYPTHPLSPDDPRLTAYALGELDDDARSAVEESVSTDPGLLDLVAEIRRTAAELSSALAGEPLPEIAMGDIALQARVVPFSAQANRPKRRSFLNSYFATAGFAAACFMLVMMGLARWQGVREREREEAAAYARQQALLAAEADRKEYLEIDFRPTARPGVGAPAAKPKPIVVVARPPSGVGPHGFIDAGGQPVSSFPLRVETTSLAAVEVAISQGERPSTEAVRIEELVNSFQYDYAAPAAGDQATFAASIEAATAPWAPKHRLVRIGLKGREMTDGKGTHAHLASEAYAGLKTIAENVRIQVRFNPVEVRAYRLIGYENSIALARDGSTSAIDAGPVEAGHVVTALYEVIPNQAPQTAAPAGDAGFLSPASHADDRPGSTDLLIVALNYNEPADGSARELEFPLEDQGLQFAEASTDFKFAAAVAGFGMLLRDPTQDGPVSLGDIIAWAEQGTGADVDGRRGQFILLLQQAGTVLQ